MTDMIEKGCPLESLNRNSQVIGYPAVYKDKSSILQDEHPLDGAVRDHPVFLQMLSHLQRDIFRGCAFGLSVRFWVFFFLIGKVKQRQLDFSAHYFSRSGRYPEVS